MKIFFVLLAVLLSLFIGCAGNQKVVKKGIDRPLPTRQAVCQNCMARFKASLGTQVLTKAMLYKQCPACSPVR